MLNDRRRPEVGSSTTRTIKIQVCKFCRCAVSEIGCDYGCGQDGKRRTPQNTFLAVYERVDTFKGDEEFSE